MHGSRGLTSQASTQVVACSCCLCACSRPRMPAQATKKVLGWRGTAEVRSGFSCTYADAYGIPKKMFRRPRGSFSHKLPQAPPLATANRLQSRRRSSISQVPTRQNDEVTPCRRAAGPRSSIGHSVYQAEPASEASKPRRKARRRASMGSIGYGTKDCEPEEPAEPKVLSERKKKEMAHLLSQMQALDDTLAGKKAKEEKKEVSQVKKEEAATATFALARRRASMGSITHKSSSDMRPTMPKRQRSNSFLKLHVASTDKASDLEKNATTFEGILTFY